MSGVSSFCRGHVWESNADTVMKLAEKSEQTLGDVPGELNT